jgi:hypothetical protein
MERWKLMIFVYLKIKLLLNLNKREIGGNAFCVTTKSRLCTASSPRGYAREHVVHTQRTLPWSSYWSGR